MMPRGTMTMVMIDGGRDGGAPRAGDDGAPARPGERRLDWARWGTVVLSLALYALACATPALQFRSEPAGAPISLEPQIGLSAAFGGFLGVFGLQFAWFANPILFCTLFCLALRRWRAALGLALLTTLVAANVLLLPGQSIPNIEGTEFYRVMLERPLIGCYLWVASILVTPIGATSGLILSRCGCRPA